jgi:integrase
MYRELWDGGDPTAGIKKWKTRKRTKICKFQEVRAILHAFDFVPTIETAPIAREADSWTGLLAIRDRALIGIELFTGCRPVEIRTAPLSAITAYGLMGCWHKGKTKNGEDQELPIPAQAMHWLAEWLKVRSLFDPWGTNPYLFPGQNCNTPLTDSAIRRRWAALRTDLGIDVRLWNYDLRRTLSSYLGNELKYDDKTIQAILNHYDGRAISHYYHVSFDALTVVIQHYADWLWAFKQEAPCSVVGSSFSASSQGAGVTRHSSPLLAALPPLVHLR